MGKTFWKILVLLDILMAAGGCRKEEIPAVDTEQGKESKYIVFRIHSPSEKSDGRSLITVEDDKINDANIFVYSDGILMEDIYISGKQTVRIALEDRESYNYYIMANTGELEAPYMEKDIRSYRYENKLGILNFMLAGFPMAQSGSFSGKDLGGEMSVELERLVARVDFRIDTGKVPGLRVTSVQLKNTPKNITPFIACSGATAVVPGDITSDADLALVNDGGYASLYMLENCQGVLLPDNSDQWEKVPENIPGNKAGLCTYMEVNAVLESPSRATGPIIFRFYLGQDETSDFNIYRNTENSVTLIITEESFDMVSWRVDNSGLHIPRQR